MESESLSERGLCADVVSGVESIRLYKEAGLDSVFTRLVNVTETGSTSKRLANVRLGGVGSMEGAGVWRGVGRGMASQSVVHKDPSWAF
jgi:hypothetical protein